MARTSYTEEILLKVKADKTELEEIQKQFDNLVVKDVISPKAKEALEKAFKDTEKRALEIKKINEELERLKGLKSPEAKDAVKELTKSKAELEKEQLPTILKDGVKKGLVDAGKKAWEKIQDLAEEIFTEAKQMMRDIAAYSENSRMFSSEATSLKMSYGLSGGQAYAAQKASQQTGFSSFDDFVQNYAFATQETRERWSELFDKYEQSYEQDKEIAEEFQKFESEWTDFKKEMSIELIHFFMENKDTIKAVMEGLIKFMEVGLQVFGGLIKLFDQNGVRSDNTRTAATADILNNQVINNGSTNKSITVSNTFNGVNTSDRQQLVNAGSLTYQQVMRALE